ncbi:MAG: NAD(P)-dependent methylenetetrahydromethanopterin dehydrogenase [Pirellulaceae bacterium]
MTRPKILIQLDSDAHASVFDAVVAMDAGVDQLLPYAHVSVEDVRDLVHGAMFTRGPKNLHNTAIFVGGSDVSTGERLLAEVIRCFFGPLRVSVLLDANGANTTAAAAVLAASRHLELQNANVLVLAATGPVGQRAVRLLARAGARVRVASRREDRARDVCETMRQSIPEASLAPCSTATSEQTEAALDGVQAVIAAGAAGIQLLPHNLRIAQRDLRVCIDLNAVPPVGIEGIEATDQGVEQSNCVGYGAIGVGATKMKIHKAAIRSLFLANDRVLDAEEVFALGKELEAGNDA